MPTLFTNNPNRNSGVFTSNCPNSLTNYNWYRVFLDSLNKVVSNSSHLVNLSNPIFTLTPTPTSSMTPTPTITPTITPTPSMTPSMTPSITPSITPTITPTPSITPSITPSMTPSITPTPSALVAKPIDFLLIGGGGPAGGCFGPGYISGGGAGGYIYKTAQSITFGSYGIVIGGSNQNSTFSGYTATHGQAGLNGQGGSAGINGFTGNYDNSHGGGGGGIGAGSGSADGGAGTTFPLFGADCYGGGGATGDCGGGGGSGYAGCGGGDAHGDSPTPNSGGGGGGYGNNAGATGIFKVRYLTTDFPSASGGTATTNGSYTIRTFTSNGTLILG